MTCRRLPNPPDLSPDTAGALLDWIDALQRWEDAGPQYLGDPPTMRFLQRRANVLQHVRGACAAIVSPLPRPTGSPESAEP